MIFWIAVAVVCVLSLGIAGWAGDDLDSIGFGIFSLILSLLVGAGIIGLAVVLPASQQNSTDEKTVTYSLTAINTGSTVHGQFYLGYGQIDGARTLNFVTTRADGSFRVEEGDADNSVIYERTGSPTVKETTYSNYRWWLAPFRFTSFATTYKFYVPKGSVLQDYTIANK